MHIALAVVQCGGCWKHFLAVARWMSSVSCFGVSTKLMLVTDSSANVKRRTPTVLQSWTSLFEGLLTELLIVTAVMKVLVHCSVVIKDLIVKAKDLTAKAKDLMPRPRPRPRCLDFNPQGHGQVNFYHGLLSHHENCKFTHKNVINRVSNFTVTILSQRKFKTASRPIYAQTQEKLPSIEVSPTALVWPMTWP